MSENSTVTNPPSIDPTKPPKKHVGTLILLAEDNEINRVVMIENLTSLNHEVDFVSNGEEAVSAWDDGNYSLILMDIQMPGMDGLEATRQIRARERQNKTEPVHIVAVTANAFENDRQDCLAAGMDDYLSKPFSYDQFCKMLERWHAKGAPGSAGRTSGENTIVQAPSAATPEDQAPGSNTSLDLAVVEPLRVGKPDLWKKLVGMYLESTPTSIDTLEQALANDDCPSAHMTAHTLKSSSANLGAAKLANLCHQLEATAGDGNLEAGPALLAEIRNEFRIVSAALTNDSEDDASTGRFTA